MEQIEQAKQILLGRFLELDVKADILKSKELKDLYGLIPKLPSDQRGAFGQAVNQLKTELEGMVHEAEYAVGLESVSTIDVTAPFDLNSSRPSLLPTEQGSVHPLTQEIERIVEIFGRMGFAAEESREIDDQFHMFESLNFPKGHPARDDYDTFMTTQAGENDDSFVAPAHTSTMQNRVIRKYADNLERNEAIAVIVPDRVFRNEDLDARHEHTFYQVEGVYVAKGVNVGNLIATLKKFLEAYYEKSLEVRVNPFYFPFTEPSFEFALSCPFCLDGCGVCSNSRWIELIGCGLIHPNVLKMADIDPQVYTGFAFGCGVDRLVMMKHGIEDVRHFHSGKLDFLRQF